MREISRNYPVGGYVYLPNLLEIEINAHVLLLLHTSQC